MLSNVVRAIDCDYSLDACDQSVETIAAIGAGIKSLPTRAYACCVVDISIFEILYVFEKRKWVLFFILNRLDAFFNV